jgi:hypothetical protein
MPWQGPHSLCRKGSGKFQNPDVSRGIDKWLWFVEAHLQAER